MRVKPQYINVGGALMDFSSPRVMGVINVTPDSFYSGSRVEEGKKVVERVASMLKEGADIIDVGGCSTRPEGGYAPFEVEEQRVLPAIRMIRKEFPSAVISVDTFRSGIARKAIEECGANIINDISGGELDRDMFDQVASLNVPYILSHWKKEPEVSEHEYFVASLLQWFSKRIALLNSKGVNDLILDPGFGFGKTLEQNFGLLDAISHLAVTELPLLIGVSRKSMIWKSLNIDPDEALNGTTAINTIALIRGADIIRVHDVKEAVEVVKLVKNLIR